MVRDAHGEGSGEHDGPAGEIDRGSPVPLYHQLEELLRQEIEGGRYAPGAALPSEGEICGIYGVSRSVVRQTLTNLAHGGLIRTERGRGSFVAERKLEEGFVDRAMGLHDDLHRMGYTIRTQVLEQSRSRLPPAAREALGTERGIRIDRLRSVDDRVLAYIRSYLRADRCPGLEEAELEDRSLYAHLSDAYDLRPRQGRRTVEAVLASGDVARYLEVADGDPLLLLRSASTDQNGEPLEWYEAWHRADRTAFAFDLEPTEGRGLPGVLLDGSGTLPGTPPGELVTTLGDVDPDTAPADAVRDPELLEAMARASVVAVLRSPGIARAADVAASLIRYGFPVVEFELTGPAALDALAEAADVPGAIVGAGGVFDAAGARDAIAAGARFLAAPIGAYDVLPVAGDTPVLIAGMTPSEVWTAWQRSRMPVKIFPASVGGPAYLRSLHGPLPNVPFLPSGGITPDNVVAYLEAGALAVDIGAALCPATALEAGDVDHITDLAAALRARIDAMQDRPAARAAPFEGRPRVLRSGASTGSTNP